MKIFVVTNFFPENGHIGGAEIQCYLLAKYLSKRGHSVNYLAWSASDGKGNDRSDENGFYVSYLNGVNQYGSGLKKFDNLIKERKPDVVFIRSFQHLFFLRRVCKKNNVPVVFNTTHIKNCSPYSPVKFSRKYKITLGSIKNAFVHYLNFTALKKVNVITINKTQSEILNKKYRLNAFHIYNSMEDNYEKNRTIKENMVVWIANLKDRKKPEIFIRLAHDLKDTGYKFLMIGYMQNNTELYTKLIEREEANNPNFRYLGGITEKDVDKILARSKILVHTCLPEGFGNNFIQAWFNECPTVSLNFDADDLMVKNKIGFHSGSYEQLKKDVRFLIDNQKITKQMGRQARNYALQNHLPQDNVKKYEKYFLQLTGI